MTRYMDIVNLEVELENLKENYLTERGWVSNGTFWSKDMWGLSTDGAIYVQRETYPRTGGDE